MKKLMAWLALSVLVAFPFIALAGSVGDWAQPHRVSFVVPSHTTASTLWRGYADSSVFTLEGSGATKPDTATLYDAGFDTTNTFSLLDIWQPYPPSDTTGKTTLGGTLVIAKFRAIQDSTYMFTLTVTPTSTIAVSDTLFVVFQYTYDGQTWIYENANKTVPARVRPLLPMLNVGASGGTSRNTCYTRDYFADNIANGTAGAQSWNLATEGRFLIRLGAGSTPKNVQVRVQKFTTGPDRNVQQ